MVFLHGLGGHPFKTWQARGKDDSGQPLFWPAWLAQDLPGVDFFSIGYAASAVGWSGQTMAIEDRADNISELLLAEEGLSDTPIYVVCHSLGGIILKSAMKRLKERAPHEEHAAALYAAIQKVAFLATPHTGSGKAGLMDWFRLLIWPTVLTKALVSNAATLRGINTSYRLLAKERAHDLRYKVFFETRRTPLGKIVDEGSADPGLENTLAIGIDGNHSSMVKPKSRDALLYKRMLDFLAEGLVKDDRPPSIILTRPPYDPEVEIDVLGILIRIVALVGLVALPWFYWPQPVAEDPDTAKIFRAIAAMKDMGERVLVAEQLIGRRLSNDELFLVENLKVPDEVAAQVDTAALTDLARTGSVDALRAAVAQIDIPDCPTEAGFEIVANILRCKNGDFVSFVEVPNQGSPLLGLKALIFHFSATSTASSTIQWFARSTSQASAHVLIDRSGSIVQMVPFNVSAWHAGTGSYRGLTGLNRQTVGIVLVNLGKLVQQPDGSFKSMLGQKVDSAEVQSVTDGGTTTYWHTYTPEQIAAATAIARAFREEDPSIMILGHEDLVPKRHFDPGPAFPLAQIDQMTR
ncbi:MAG: N-acetylmuramoyl-L-alanine amidase [Tabrizicola sp.]|nr:N-acetylmuramoyl-L-alanine amidase [Tabrizicola sp.]